MNQVTIDIEEGSANVTHVDMLSVEIGVPGLPGPPGPPGQGIPPGGNPDDILAKESDDDYDTKWVTISTGSGLTPEQIRDLVAAFIVQGFGMTITHNDAADTLTFHTKVGAGTNNTFNVPPTGDMAPNTPQTASFSLAANGMLLTSIATNYPARITLYASDADMTADAGRAAGINPVGDHGVLLDFVTTVSDLDWMLSPTVSLATRSGAATYYARVTNLDTVNRLIQVQLRTVQLGRS